MKQKIILLPLLLILGIIVTLFVIDLFERSPVNPYTYVGTIIDMEGGSSGSIIIIELDTIGKTPYTMQKFCSNKIRIGQKVYEKKGSEYLWVEYEPEKYC